MDIDVLLNLFHTMEKKYEKYKPKLLESNKTLFNMNNVEEKVKIIKDLYAYIKNISVELYSKERKEFIWLQNLVQLLTYCEDSLDNEYLIDTSINFGKERSNIASSEEIKVNKIVYLTRKALLKQFQKYGSPHPFDFYNVEDYCEESSNITSTICKDMPIRNLQIKINYGFSNNQELFDGKGHHYFSIVEIRNKKYLVDCTYKQFFLLKRSLLERIGIPYLGGCYPGVFMLMADSRRHIAEKVLKDGWILLTDDVFKDYMDGFLISWRNGLYYEETNDFSYTTPYTAEDYWNFLIGKDNLLNYEKEFTLGFQKTPLKNPNLYFKKN